MKKVVLLMVFIFSISCKNKRPEPNFFKNLYTGEIIGKSEMRNYIKNKILPKDKDSLQKMDFRMVYYKLEQKQDSVILNFKYNLRYEDKYLIRENEYNKIGMQISATHLTSIEGKSVVIGGKQDKPTVINLWFIGCSGCVAEIPELNLLSQKYAGKVNFIALNYQRKERVLKFLKKKDFNFTHIADADNFISKIGSHPYPETIFIDRNGYITHIETILPKMKNSEDSIKYFEFIINKLL